MKKAKEPKLPKFRGRGKKDKNNKADRQASEDFWVLMGTLFLILLILFVLLGGINQVKFWQAMKDIGQKIGETIFGWVKDVDVEVNDKGIYLKP